MAATTRQTRKNAAAPEASPSISNTWRCEPLVIVFLICWMSLAWCAANRKWLPADWAVPTTYVDPIQSDFHGVCGIVKAQGNGRLNLFGGKLISDLAAPDGADWSGTATPDELLFCGLVALTKALGLFAGLNVGMLLGHIAAALTFYLVARNWLQSSRLWSFVGAIAFGLAPYLFAESPHHPNCVYAWHLPLFPMVWAWSATGSGLAWRSRRFWQSVAIGLVTGLQNPYYTFVFCQLLLLGGSTLAWQRKSRTPLATACVVVAASACGFLVSNLDTIAYRLSQDAGSTPFVTNREYKWMDIYGFKIVDMFVPGINHHSDAFAAFGLAHRQASVLNDEEGCAYLGLLGIACLLVLVGAAVRAMVEGRANDVPLTAWWVLWIVLFFNTGGLNSVVATFTNFTLFRTACRYSVMILVIVLLDAVHRLSLWQREGADRYPRDLMRIGSLTAACAACLLVLWDQVPRAPSYDVVQRIRQAVASDRNFVGSLESALPDKAMIFQLPVMDGTPLPGVPSSDHYRPYLYSTRLHWSHGAVPGSKTLQWQQSVQQRLVDGASIDQQAQQVRFKADNVRKAVEEMRSKGFAAIYVNRNGFPDRGKGLFGALLELGYDTPPIYSPAGDLACIQLGDQPAK